MRKFCWVYQSKSDGRIWLMMKPRHREVQPLWLGLTYDTRGHQLPMQGFDRRRMRQTFQYVGRL